MSDPVIPAGAFAAMKAGAPQPSAAPTPPKAPVAAPEALQQHSEPDSPPEGLTAAEKKIWRLKADGEEFDFDASDEESIKREIMKARGADKRFKESAALRQQAEQFFEMLKDPASLKKVLSDPRIGIDVKKWAQDTVWDHMQEESMTPEQKAQRERDQEYEGLKNEKQRREQEAADAQKRQREAVWETEYEKKILSALQSNGVPQTHETVQKMASFLMTAIEQGYDLNPDEIAKLVRDDTGSYLKSYADSLTEDEFIAFIGESNAAKVRKADLKKIRSPQSSPFPQRSKQTQQETKAKKPTKMVATDWKAALQKDFLNRPR